MCFKNITSEDGNLKSIGLYKIPSDTTELVLTHSFNENETIHNVDIRLIGNEIYILKIGSIGKIYEKYFSVENYTCNADYFSAMSFQNVQYSEY